MDSVSQFRTPRASAMRVSAIFATTMICACIVTYAQSGAIQGVLPSFELSNPVHGLDRPQCDLLEAPELQKSVSKKLRQQRAEWALGKKLAADAEQKVVLVAADFLLEYVNALEQRIVSGSNLSGCFVVKVLIDDEPNAYSLPGGFIYLSTGLIDLVENEGQLVGALAHETAHVAGRHLTTMDHQARMGRRLAFAAGPVGYGLRRVLGPLLLMKLMRDKEFEADQLGLQYHIASGYKPLDFCNLLQIAFPDDEQDSESAFERLSDTHPATADRIERLQAALRVYPLSQTNYLDARSEFAEMKMHFAIMMAAKQAAQSAE